MAGPTAPGNGTGARKTVAARWRAVGLVVFALLLATLPARAQTTPCKIAVLGDSLTASYGLAIEQGFPARLDEALQAKGLDCTVIDAGVSGDTSAGGLARLGWVLSENPTRLIVELGANDGLRALPTDQLKRNLEAIVAQAREKKIPVFLAGMLAPPNLGAAYGKAFAQVYRDVAERYDIPLYTFFLDGVAGDPKLNQADGIHPTAEGVDIVVARITPAIVEWLHKDS